MALTPEEQEELRQLEAEEASTKTEQLARQIDPSQPLPPQILATQASTTHEGGDEAAEAQWVARGPESIQGSVVMYEPPVERARQDLMSNPQLSRALIPDVEFTPEELAAMDDEHPLYQAYSDYKWGEAATAAKGAGKTAYRYSRMPWLHGDEAGMGPLSMLGTKLKAAALPAFDTVSSFVLGADAMGSFGAGKQAAQTTAPEEAERPPKPEGDYYWHPTLGWTPGELGKPKDELVASEQTPESLAEEHPVANALGGLYGIYVGPAAALWKGLGIAGKGALGALGGGAGRQLAGRMALAAPTAAVGAGATELASGGVEALGAAVRGEEGPSLSEVASRAETAALDPTNLALGVAGEAAGALGGAVAKSIANSPRYKGAIARLEQLGGKVKFGKGPTGSPRVEKAIEQAKAADLTPEDLLAGELAPKIEAVENEAVGAVKKTVKDENAVYYSSPEGQQRLPVNETVNESVRQLRQLHTGGDGKPLRVIGRKAPASRVKTEFNSDIESVSLEPVEGAIELSADEAEAFLAPHWLKKIRPTPRGAKPPEGGGGRVNKQGVNVAEHTPPAAAEPVPAAPEPVAAAPEAPPPRGEAPTVPPKGKAAKAAGKVEALPERDVTPTKLYPESNAARNEYGENMRPYREAQKADNARASKLSEEFSEQGSTKLSPERVKALRSQSDDVASKLTEQEVDAVRSFTSRQGDKVGTPEWESAVKKLTVANPTEAGPLYRGTRMTAEEIASVIKKGEYSTKSPTSLSYNKDLSDAFAHGREGRGQKVMFEVESLNEGQNFLSPKLGVGRSGLEREINVARPTNFKVVGHSVDGEGVTHIRLRDAGTGTAKAGADLGDSWKTGKASVDAALEKRLRSTLSTLESSKEPLSIWHIRDRAGLQHTAQWEVEQLQKMGLVRKATAAERPQGAAVDILYVPTGKSAEAGTLSPRDAVAKAIKEEAAANPQGALLKVRAVRERAGLSKEEFDKAALEMGRSGDVSLHHHDHAKAMAPEERAGLIQDGGRDFAGIIGRGALATAVAAGAAEASGDEDGAAAQAAAGGLGLALLLKKRGKSKVYVVPRRYTAKEHEVRKGQLQKLARDPTNPAEREAKKLYQAVLRDRDQRPMGGKVGGWSERQRANAEKIARTKAEADLASPGGNAYRPLVKHARQSPGEGPRKEALEAAADRGGVRQELNDIRQLDPLQSLRGSMGYKGRAATSPRGLLGGFADHAALRLLYPGLKPVGDPLSGATLGPKLLQLREREDEEQ
jgi:hypothetical protein